LPDSGASFSRRQQHEASTIRFWRIRDAAGDGRWKRAEKKAGT